MPWLLISDIALLAVLGALGVVVIVLARQIGVLHERTAPVGAMMQRAKQISRIDLHALEVQNLADETIDLARLADGQGLALLFVGPDCPVCSSLLPRFEAAFDELPFVPCWVGNAQPRTEQATYSERHGLDKARYLVTPQLGINLQIMQTPTLAVVDGDGAIIVREKLRGPKQLARLAARLHTSRLPTLAEGEAHELA